MSEERHEHTGYFPGLPNKYAWAIMATAGAVLIGAAIAIFFILG